jgi:hypothetical protein
MSGIVQYDELLALTGFDLNQQPPDPFHSLGKNPGEEDSLKWAMDAKQSVWDATRSRANKQITVSAMCQGRYYDNQDANLDFRDPKTLKFQQHSKVTIPEHHRYVNTLSARLSKFQPGIQVGPYTNEFQDKDAARVGQKVIDSLDKSLNLNLLKKKMVKKALKFGEQVVVVEWDEKGGPVDPQWHKDKKKYGDKAYSIKCKKTGEVREYDPDKPTRAGGFKLSLPLPWNVLMDPQSEPSEVQWVIICKGPQHIDNLRARFPKKKGKLNERSSKAPGVDYDDAGTYENHFDEYHLYVRSSEQLPKGKKIIFLEDLVLESGDNPLHDIEALQDSEWGDLPIERMVDIDLDGELHGFSSLYLVHNLIHAKNRIITMAYRNFQLAGHPKWLVHKGAKIQRSALGNDATLVTWHGNIPPTLAQMATIPPGSLELYNIFTAECDKVMNVHPVSSGTPPPGIKAGVAIRLLEEIEEANLTNLIDNIGNLSVALGRRLLSMAGKYMSKGAHLIRIVGEDDADVIEEFEPDILTKPFNYKLEKISNQARSPAARMQNIIDLVEVVKDSTTQEQILDAMDLIEPNKISDPGVAAVQLAEYENELCGQDKPMLEPREGERLSVHWNVHMAYYQRRGFQQLPTSAQERFREHMIGTEFLMSELAMLNPMFEQQVLSLPGYPAFYHLPPDQMAKRQALIQGPQAATQPMPEMGSEQLMNPEEMMMPQQPMTGQEIAQG